MVGIRLKYINTRIGHICIKVKIISTQRSTAQKRKFE